MNVIELRQLAVFMNAGSYVINPKSSGPVLICRRSMARTVPFWIGSSYFFPVRLSVIERVSGIGHYSTHTRPWTLDLGPSPTLAKDSQGLGSKDSGRSGVTVAGVVSDVAGR